MAAYAESLGGEPLTLFECRSGSLLLDNVEESGILSLRGYNDHVVEVLGAGTDKANATDINLFDDGSIVRTAGNGLLEGIEVDDDEVDFGDFVLCHLLAVALKAATAEDSSEHFGVKCLHTSAKYGGVGGDILDLLTGIAEAFNETLGASGRKELYTLCMELGEQFVETVLVEYGNKRRLYLLRILHRPDCILFSERIAVLLGKSQSHLHAFVVAYKRGKT